LQALGNARYEKRGETQKNSCASTFSIVTEAAYGTTNPSGSLSADGWASKHFALTSLNRITVLVG
jgi:hypothetical protein